MISQSNYIPWKGYFDAINLVDEFVIFDDMQYTKRDWRNRNKIKTINGSTWLSIPVEVKGKYFQKINETTISDSSWNKDHWNSIKNNYAKASHFNDMKDMVEEWYATANFKYLTEINIHFINKICSYLGIVPNIRLSSEFKLAEEKSERLVNICKNLDATDYYSGAAAKAYMNEDLFGQHNINVHYFDYTNYSEYDQLYPPFQHGVSILDLLFNKGIEAKKYMKSFKA